MPRVKRKVLPGFPKSLTFSTRSELDAYLEGDKIQCLLCGQFYRILDTHLRAQHSITSDDYRDEYGIPSSRGLCGSERTARDRDRMKRKMKDDPNELERLVSLAKTSQKSAALASKLNQVRPKPQYWKAERTKYTRENWEEVGRLVIGGEGLTRACRAIGVQYTVLSAAKKRWPDFGQWWDAEVAPKMVNWAGHNLTKEARTEGKSSL